MKFISANFLVFTVTLILLSVSSVKAADDGWEWTKSAGWSRAEGTAKGTPEEQLQYAKDLQKKGNFYDAARQYFLLVRTFPNSREASRAILSLAECLFSMENYYASFKALEQSIEKYPKSIHLPALLELEFRIGKRFSSGAPPSLFNSKDPKRDSLVMAIEVFKAIIGHDEYGPLADDCYSELGMAYLELNHPQKAKDNLSILLTSFPESPLVPLARYRIALANIQLGQGTLDEAKKRLEELRLEVEQSSKEGKAPVTNEALQKDMATLQEEDARRMYEAAHFYIKRGSPKSYDAAMFSLKEVVRRYPETQTAETAKEAIDKLRRKGRPKKGIGERNFSLPNLPLPSVSKIPVANKLAFWSKDEEKQKKEEEANRADGAPPKMGYSAVSVKPLSNVYQVGKVTVDLEAEKSRLSSAAKPAKPAVPLEGNISIEEQSAVIRESAEEIVAREDSIVSGKPIGAEISEDDVLLEIPASGKPQRNISNTAGGADNNKPSAVMENEKSELEETKSRLEDYEKEAEEELRRMREADAKTGKIKDDAVDVDIEDEDIAVVEKTLNAPEPEGKDAGYRVVESEKAIPVEEVVEEKVETKPERNVTVEKAAPAKTTSANTSGWTLSDDFVEDEE